MITAEEANRLSNIAVEKEKAENFEFIIKDIDKEIQKAISKGYSSIYYDILKLVDISKVKEYLLSYGYQCRTVNITGCLSLDISWKDPEAARKEYDVLIRLKAKFNEPLFKFDEVEGIKSYGA